MTNNYSEIASQPSFEVRISEGDSSELSPVALD
jgi:hypothetical protein